jgi:hypothetical protein
MSAELRCADGTVVQISAETEQELRKAFEPKPVYKVGDIVWRDEPCLSGGNYLQLRKDRRGVGVGLYDPMYPNSSMTSPKLVGNPDAITHDEVCRMTNFPAGLRPVKAFNVTEITK